MKVSLLLFLLSSTVLGTGIVMPMRQTPPPKPKPVQTAINFNRDIKPILSESCFKCHGPDAGTVAAGLRLDTYEGATDNKKGYAAIVPGKPAESFLLSRAAHPDPDFAMPPKDAGVPKLTKPQLDLLRRWIAQGAKYESHWSFQPPKKPVLPHVSNYRWIKNNVDRFVMARLDDAQLKPEPEADRPTLAMRASLALTGLPPTDTLLNGFLNDDREGAYERYVDRLLELPTYGEHQARYWLDAVRYGDTHGLHLDNERGIYPYRDWVVRAFNDDLPFDKFTLWQLAGDLLEKPSLDQLIATGYIRMNPTTAEGGAIEDEFLAKNTFDRVDTTSTVFLGLTVACARCHDHKYDPIPQKDYFQLYAFFNSTADKPLDDNILLPPPAIRAPTPDQRVQEAELEREHKAHLASVDLNQAKAWLVAAKPPILESSNWEVSPVYAAENFDQAHDRAEAAEPGQDKEAGWKPLPFEFGKAFESIINKDNASVYVRGVLKSERAATFVLSVNSDDGVKVWLNGKLIHNNKVPRGITAAADSVKLDLPAGESKIVFKVSNGAAQDGLMVRVGDAFTARIAALAAQPEPNEAQLRQLYLEAGPETPKTLEYRAFAKRKAEFDAQVPMTLIAKELEKPRVTRILRRGEYNLPGDEVDRAVPSALGRLDPKMPVNRLGLAQWMVNERNPLVGRVFVNRIWQQHFGTGIVKTAEDFGSQGEWPANPALLDYLAVTFREKGWSVKQLHREIVTSAAFRQRSTVDKTKLERDPENRWASRGPKYRLDAEVIRDRALAASGLLVQEMGGRGFRPYQPDGIWEAIGFDISNTSRYVRDKGPMIYRRSLYLFWKRTSPHPVMLAFDAPMREMCTVTRSRTNTPLQALVTLNEPMFVEASRVMAERVHHAGTNDNERLEAAYRMAFGRPPQAAERKLLLEALNRYRGRYLGDQVGAMGMLKVGDSPRDESIPPHEHIAWALVCSTLMNTDEFLTLR